MLEFYIHNKKAFNCTTDDSKGWDDFCHLFFVCDSEWTQPH